MPQANATQQSNRSSVDNDAIRPLPVNISEISSISPFFIVEDFAASLSFYRDQLGFDITYQEPADDPFFGIVHRGGAMIMLKDVGVGERKISKGINDRRFK